MPGGNKSIFRRTLSETSATAADLGTPGETREDSKTGSKHRLVYLAGAVTSGHVLQFDSLSGGDGYTVVSQYSNNVKGAGVQNQAGSNLGSGIYCWAQYAGIGSCSVSASYAANLHLAATTGGSMITAASSAGARIHGQTIQSVTTGVVDIRIMME